MEALRRRGALSLSDTELVALLLTQRDEGERFAVARKIAVAKDGLPELVDAGVAELRRRFHLSPRSAGRLLAAAELGVRIVERRQGAALSRQIGCSADVFESYRVRLGLLRQETFFAIGLSNRNQVIRERIVAVGTINECRVEPRDVFRPMIAESVARSVLVHNHPSGDPTPSPHDVALTRRLARVGQLIGIPVLDHVIIGRGEYASLRDLGLMDEESAVE